MEQILSKVSDLERASFLDGFLGYNQFLVKKSNRHNISLPLSGAHMHTVKCLLD